MDWKEYNKDFNYAIGILKPRPWGYEYLVAFEKKDTGEHFNHVLFFKNEPKTQTEIDTGLAGLMEQILQQLSEPEEIPEKVYEESEILEILKAKNIIPESTEKIDDIEVATKEVTK